MAASLATLLFTTFTGRLDVYAVATEKGFRPSQRPLTVRDLELHVTGSQCFGFYVMQPDNHVRCSAIDFDEKSDPEWKAHACAVAEWLLGAGMEPLIEQSQSGAGAHVWLFHEPTEAWCVRSFWRLVGARCNLTFREIFPKQDRLVTEKGLGNLIRYPLWRESRFVDAEWNTLDPLIVLPQVQRYGPSDLSDLAARAGYVLTPDPATASVAAEGGCELPPRVSKAIKSGLLRRRWEGDTSGMRDASRSAAAMSVACELIRRYVPTYEIEIAVRAFMRKHGADEKAERDDWVRYTVRKAYDLATPAEEAPSLNMGTMEEATYQFIDTIPSRTNTICAMGVDGLTASVDGVQFGEMWLACARPGHGKTMFCLQWLNRLSAAGVPSLLLSEEMGAVALGKRNLLHIAPMSEEYWSAETVKDLRESVAKRYADAAPIYLVEQCVTIERTEEVVTQAVDRGVRAVVVDYMQMLKGRGERTFESVADVSKRLKRIAIRHNVAMFCAVQLSREVEKRAHGPKLSDLGDSGQLERDADGIVVFDWPWRTDPRAAAETPDVYLAHILKRRNGPIRETPVSLSFDPNTQTLQ